MSNLLSVQDLHVTFVTPDRTVHAVNGVSFDVKRGETLGILGESGSGKSVTLRSILKLHPEHRTRWSGSIKLEGDEVLGMTGGALADLRGNRVAMIFQEPATAFDPVFTIGHQIAETIRRHTGKSETDAWKRAKELLELDLEWTFFAVSKKVEGAPVVQFERLVNEVTSVLPTRYLHMPRIGPDSRFLPVKDNEELSQRQGEIELVARARGIIE